MYGNGTLGSGAWERDTGQWSLGMKHWKWSLGTGHWAVEPGNETLEVEPGNKTLEVEPGNETLEVEPGNKLLGSMWMDMCSDTAGGGGGGDKGTILISAVRLVLVFLCFVLFVAN